MYIQVSQAIVILVVWVFCLLQDKWFDKALIYQIKGHAEKYRTPSSKAVDLYKKTKSKNIWIILAISLTFILISTHIRDVFLSISLIIFGLFFLIYYIYMKLITYNKSSALIDKRN
jgi:hypothetical protein